jgi:hypothetical protein
MKPISSVETIYRKATSCRECFDLSEVDSPVIDIAQPRWIGRRYFSTQPRVAIAMLNPGSGDNRLDTADKIALDVLRSFSSGTIRLEDVFSNQIKDMKFWGRGRFLSFYTEQLGLKLNDIAMLNIALCATRHNLYPRSVLDRCFSTHTARLVALLNPDIILLSGSATHRFSKRMNGILPHAKVIPMLHFAHRKGKVTEARFQDITRRTIQKFKK